MAFLSAGSLAQAKLGLATKSFGTPYILDPSNIGGYIDYTLPTDGLLYLWNFTITSADPNALFVIPFPNEVESFASYKTSTGLTNTFDQQPVNFQFRETVTEGLTSILYQAPLAYNNCATAGISDTVPCQLSYNVWGNGDPYSLLSTAPITFVETLTAIPEPAEWTMLLAGFGGMGVMLRRRRKGLRLTA